MNDSTPDSSVLFALGPCGFSGAAYASGNAAFRHHHMGRLLHRCGVLLPQWLDGEELLSECRSLEQTCWRELGYAKAPLFDDDLPTFLMEDASGRPLVLSVPLTPLELSARLTVAVPSPLPASSPVGTNLERLVRLLGFTHFESQWLLWAYCLARFGSGLLPAIPLSDEQQGCERLALLCEVPVDVVRDAVALCRLHAWGLLHGVDDAAMPSSLAGWLSACDPFAEWIESSYASDSDLMRALCQALVLPYATS